MQVRGNQNPEFVAVINAFHELRTSVIDQGDLDTRIIELDEIYSNDAQALRDGCTEAFGAIESSTRYGDYTSTRQGDAIVAFVREDGRIKIQDAAPLLGNAAYNSRMLAPFGADVSNEGMELLIGSNGNNSVLFAIVPAAESAESDRSAEGGDAESEAASAESDDSTETSEDTTAAETSEAAESTDTTTTSDSTTAPVPERTSTPDDGNETATDTTNSSDPGTPAGGETGGGNEGGETGETGLCLGSDGNYYEIDAAAAAGWDLETNEAGIIVGCTVPATETPTVEGTPTPEVGDVCIIDGQEVEVTTAEAQGWIVLPDGTCVKPVTTPTPEVTPTNTPTPEPTPETVCYYNGQPVHVVPAGTILVPRAGGGYDCVIPPTPTPEPTPSATPTATPSPTPSPTPEATPTPQPITRTWCDLSKKNDIDGGFGVIVSGVFADQAAYDHFIETTGGVLPEGSYDNKGSQGCKEQE